LEIGDYDDLLSIDDELMEIKLQLRQPPEPAAPKPTPVELEREPIRQVYQEPTPTANTPQAQQDWENSNQWIYDEKQKPRLDKANKIFKELLDDGYDLDDPDTFVQLDKRLKREVPPSPGAPDRGQVIGSDSKTGFTAEDKRRMAAWGLDPDDPKHRKEWIKNRK
jgi:hypothetical protein